MKQRCREVFQDHEKILDMLWWVEEADRLPATRQALMDALRDARAFCSLAHVVFPWERLGKRLLLPFDVQWNRLCALWIREILRANELHRGIETETEAVLDREWTLSGWNRSVVLAWGIHVGDEPYSPNLSDDDLEADEVVVV